MEEKIIILVVDDDSYILEILQTGLEDEGYGVITANDGITALKLLEETRPSLVLLDIQLPDIDGFALCKLIRETSFIPIIIVSGAFLNGKDKVEGLEAGADDYVTKPIHFEELFARVKAVLRRSSLTAKYFTSPPVKFRDLKIDFIHQIVTAGEKRILITGTEYKILSYLALHAGRIIGPQELLREVWGSGYEMYIDMLWVNISRLRQKLSDNENNKYIETVPGGYLMRK